MSFYENFIRLCKQKGVSPSVAVKSIGLGTPNATYWKKGSTPKMETVKKLAEYFEVTIDDLMSEEEQSAVIIKSIKEKLSDGRPFTKIPFEQVLPKISSPPESDEDRIAYFYSKLNTDGKLAAARCFFYHLKEEDLKVVAEYVEGLSKTPQFQKIEGESMPVSSNEDVSQPDAPTDGPDEKSDEE